MAGQVLNNPRRWLGVDEDPPLAAALPARVLDALRDRRLDDVTPASALGRAARVEAFSYQLRGNFLFWAGTT